MAIVVALVLALVVLLAPRHGRGSRARSGWHELYGPERDPRS
jgi:preprotein translocase subunit SecG